MVQQPSFGGTQNYPGGQRQYPQNQMVNNFAMPSAPMDRGMSQQQQPHSPRVAMNPAATAEESK